MPNPATRRKLTLEIAAKTDPGRLRTVNEDSIVTDGDLGLLVLSDGMGGYQSGDVASSITTQVIAEGLKASLQDPANRQRAVSTIVESVVKRANRAIFKEGQRRTEIIHGSQEQRMGSTLALLLLRDDRITLAHVGDSRIYRLRDHRLELMTHDHSLLQEQIDQGVLTAEAAATSHNRHLVTRALGLQADVDVTLDECEAKAGDLYLLCSDGLNDMVDNDDIELVLDALQANLPLAASQLVMIANDNGGDDNISVILARVGAGGRRAAGKSGLLGWLFGR